MNGGGEATRIERLITVNSTDTLLDFFFSVVMPDPNHPLHEQPYIFVEVYDSSGGVLSLVDSIFVLGGTPALTLDTTTFGSWKYIDWCHQQFNLSSFSGKKVLLRITNGDCGYGGHSGRVYLDFSMNPKRQYVTSYLCSSSDSIQFRGNSYDSIGTYSDTVWSGSTIDSVFTLFIKGIIVSGPTTAYLTNYNLCASPTVFDMDCFVSGSLVGTLNYNWMVNGSSYQSGTNTYLTYSTTTNDTIYCLVTQVAGNCFVEYSDTLIVGPSISVPLVNLQVVGSDLKASVSGGRSPYAYSWKVNFPPILIYDSAVTTSLNGSYYVWVTDANGCETKDSISNYNVGLEDNISELNFSFYPNPASNSIYLELNGEKGVIEILDVQGKLIQTTNVSSDGELNLESLESGTYLIRFRTNSNKVVTKKLVVE